MHDVLKYFASTIIAFISLPRHQIPQQPIEGLRIRIVILPLREITDMGLAANIAGTASFAVNNYIMYSWRKHRSADGLADQEGMRW